MMTLHTLASGSSGNAALFSWSGGHLLADAGISCRRTAAALKELGLTLGDLGGILITHTHSDHIAGLPTLLKKTACPLWAAEAAGQVLRERLPELEGRFQPLPLCRPVSIRGCAVTAVPTSHDAPGACGFRFDTEEGSAALLTDTGVVTAEAEAILPGVHLALLEANHDVETLKSGPYPYQLKRRILGPAGHLRNEDAAAFAVTLARAGAAEIVLAHLSRENNTPAMALWAVETALSAAGLSPALFAAPQDHLSQAYGVRRAVCSG